MLVCNLLHGCRVVLVWQRWKKWKWKKILFLFTIIIIIILFVLKWICSLLLRVTTNHLYSLGKKCRFTWRLMILCACSDFFQLCPSELSLVKMLVRINRLLVLVYLGPRIVKMNFRRSQSTVGNPSRWREAVGLFQLCLYFT